MACTRELFRTGLCLGFAALQGWAFAYTPGSGTGLRGAVMGPIPWRSSTYYKDIRVCESRAAELPAVDLPATTSPFETAEYQQYKTAIYCWRGKLIVPAAGEYVFRTEHKVSHTDMLPGVRVRIDGTDLIDVYRLVPTATSTLFYTDEASVNLTAGEHEIAIDYLARGGGGASIAQRSKYFKVQWRKPDDSGFEQIPISAFTPAEESEMPTYYDGNFGLWMPPTYYGDTIPELKILSENSIGIRGTMNVASYSDRSTFYATERTGEFVCEGEFATNDILSVVALQPLRFTESDHTYAIFPLVYYKDTCRLSFMNNATLIGPNVTVKADRLALRIVRDAQGAYHYYYRSRNDNADWTVWKHYDSFNGTAYTYNKKTYSFDLSAETVSVGFTASGNGGFLTVTNLYCGMAMAPTNTQAESRFDGVRLNWCGARGVSSSLVQYRVKGASAWTDYGEPLAADVTSLVLTGLDAPNFYEFRVVTQASDGTSQAGEIVSASIGHGLRRVTMGPVARRTFTSSYGVNKREVCSSPSLPSLELTAGDSIYENPEWTETNTDNVVFWCGKLQVETAGTYVFAAEVVVPSGQSRGYRLKVDGETLADVYSIDSPGNSLPFLTAEGSCALATGNHSLEICYIARGKTSSAMHYGGVSEQQHFQLQWKTPGTSSYAPIPLESLQTGAEDDLPNWQSDGFALWTGSTAQNTKVPDVTRLAGDGIRLVGGNASYVSPGDPRMLAQFLKPQSGDIFCETAFSVADVGSDIGLVFRADGGIDVNEYGDTSGYDFVSISYCRSNGRVSVFLSAAHAATNPSGKEKGYVTLAAEVGAVRLRGRRKLAAGRSTIELCYSTSSALVGPWSAWTKLFTYDSSDSTHLAAADLTTERLHFGLFTSCNDASVVEYLKTCPPGFMLILR